MEAPLFSWLSQLPRPPALGPRRRTIDPAVERKLDSWIRGALQVSEGTKLELSEWVSMDSRAVPHTLCVIVRTDHACRHFSIEKASERIAEADLRPSALLDPEDLGTLNQGACLPLSVGSTYVPESP